jgi:hypothetical protein
LLINIVSIIAAQDLATTSGLNSLPEVEFSQLSQRDPNPLGEKALAIHPDQWKHAETEHFIYHFTHSYVATPVSVDAELFNKIVAKKFELNKPADATNRRVALIKCVRSLGTVDWRNPFGWQPLYSTRSSPQVFRQRSRPRDYSSRHAQILSRRNSMLAGRGVRAVRIKGRSRQLPARPRLHIKTAL